MPDPFDTQAVTAMRDAAAGLPFAPIGTTPVSESLWVSTDVDDRGTATGGRALVLTTDAQAAGAWAHALANANLPVTVHGVGEFTHDGQTLFAALVSLETDGRGRWTPPTLPPADAPVASVGAIDAPEDLVTDAQLERAEERIVLATPHLTFGQATARGLLVAGESEGPGRYFLLGY